MSFPDLFLRGLAAGMGVYYLVYTLVYADGWVTVSKLRGKRKDTLETTDDVLSVISVRHPTLAVFLGCVYCMAFWLCLGLAVAWHHSLTAFLTSLGVVGISGSLRDALARDGEL